MTGFHLILTRAIAVLGAVLFAGAALSADIDRSVTADGLVVYYGVMPAGNLRDFPAGSEEAMAHGQLPKGPNVYHLVVAVFDNRDNERVTDARLSARVGEPGLAWVRKSLAPTVLAGELTFCNFFTLADHHEYRFQIDIKRPDNGQIVTAEFNYKN
jgi:hypothetical protein